MRFLVKSRDRHDQIVLISAQLVNMQVHSAAAVGTCRSGQCFVNFFGGISFDLDETVVPLQDQVDSLASLSVIVQEYGS